jgi:alpha-glucuronidase
MVSMAFSRQCGILLRLAFLLGGMNVKAEDGYGLKKTKLAAELQITQEYFGHSTHLVYLGNLWHEFLASDTYARGKGSLVAAAVDGTLFAHKDSLIAGVANTGNDRNWCGHPFAAANWYAFGREVQSDFLG